MTWLAARDASSGFQRRRSRSVPPHLVEAGEKKPFVSVFSAPRGAGARLTNRYRHGSREKSHADGRSRRRLQPRPAILTITPDWTTTSMRLLKYAPSRARCRPSLITGLIVQPLNAAGIFVSVA
jgi:hypothetical protein